MSRLRVIAIPLLLLLAATAALPSASAAPACGPTVLGTAQCVVDDVVYLVCCWDPALLPWVLEAVEDAVPPPLP